MNPRRNGGVVHDLPLVIGPARGVGHRPPHRHRDRLGGEPEHHGVGAQAGCDRRRDLLRIGCRGQTFERGVEVVERLVGLQEEVARDADVAEQPRLDVEVDDHELATGHLVFTVHGVKPTDQPAAPRVRWRHDDVLPGPGRPHSPWAKPARGAPWHP